MTQWLSSYIFLSEVRIEVDAEENIRLRWASLAFLGLEVKIKVSCSNNQKRWKENGSDVPHCQIFNRKLFGQLSVQGLEIIFIPGKKNNSPKRFLLKAIETIKHNIYFLKPTSCFNMAAFKCPRSNH